MNTTVLHLIPSLSGGGAERQVSYLIPALAEHGVEAHLAYISPGSNFIRCSQGAAQLHQLAASSNYDPRLYLRISRLIASVSPDVVQTWLTQMDVLGGIAALRRHVPFVLSERNSADAYQSNFKNSVRAWVGSHADAVVANSIEGTKYWQSGNAGPKTVVIPNGVPIAELDSLTDEKVASTERREILLYAGRFVDAKNVQLVLRAFLNVLKHRNAAEAFLFGNGDCKDELQAIAGGLSHGDRVHVCDYTDELWKWMKRASVFVNASRHEGQPNTVLEAAALKCPLVLSDIPAHREAVGRYGARWLDSADADSISSAIMETLDDRPAATLRTSAARRVVENRSVDECAVQYCNLYNELTDGRAAKPVIE